jgi:hypothetical protein
MTSLSSVTVISPVSSSTPDYSCSSPPHAPIISTLGVGSSSSMNFQNQMMAMLNETFSKLSTVLVDSKALDSKSDWPKFSGDPKKF